MPRKKITIQEQGREEPEEKEADPSPKKVALYDDEEMGPDAAESLDLENEDGEDDPLGDFMPEEENW